MFTVPSLILFFCLWYFQKDHITNGFPCVILPISDILQYFIMLGGRLEKNKLVQSDRNKKSIIILVLKQCDIASDLKWL